MGHWPSAGFACLEDASHAIGGRYKSEPGATALQRHHGVQLPPGEDHHHWRGGLATTNDPVLAQRMAELRSHGITKDEERFERPAAGPWSYEQQRLGFNYRMTDLQAALGLSQLERLDAIVAERNNQLQRYRSLLADLPVQLLEIPDDVLSSVHLAVIRLSNATSEQHRRVFEGLRAAAIGVQLHYTPVHLQPYYRKLGFHEGDFPEAEVYADKRN